MSGLKSLATLEGQWSLSRRILHDGGLQDLFEGKVVFVRSGPRLIHDEDGWLRPGTGGAALKATRRYIWTQSGDQIDVLFEDMRPFHRFSANVEKPSATHLCPPDRYEVAYDFSDFPAWTAEWRVEGPRKAYTMKNTFRRSFD